MIEKEKVCKGLKCCVKPMLSPSGCRECPYQNEEGICSNKLMRDALRLLEGQDDRVDE